MADEATLKDTLTTDPAPAAAPEAKADTAKAAPAPPAPSPEDTEAMEIGRILRDSGYTKAQVNDLLQAPQALQSMRYLVQNDPQEFVRLLERQDSKAGERFLEQTADLYVKRYAPKDTAPGKATDPKAASAELMGEVEALREKVSGFETREQQRANAAAAAQIKSRYEARVDDLFAQLPKDSVLTKAESKALRAQLSQELGADTEAVTRISNGNFVDVPRRFSDILNSWSADKKATADAAKAARDGVKQNAGHEILGGPQLTVDLPTGFDESWDNTEEAFAAALTKSAR